MISLFLLLSSALVVILTFIYLKKNGNTKRLPGPIGIPIFGNLLQMGAFQHLKLKEWVKKYGPIYEIKLGPNRVVVISDSALIREAFNDTRMLARMDHKIQQIFTDGPYGFSNAEVEEWMQLRRFSMKILRDLGFGKTSMEGLIMEEVNDFLSFLKDTEGKPISPERRLNICTLNTIWGVLSAGNRVEQDDEECLDLLDRQNSTNFHKLMLHDALWGFVENLVKPFIFFVPNLAKKLPSVLKLNALEQVRDDKFEIFRQRIDEHKNTLPDNNSDRRDFIDAYLQEARATEDPKSCFYKERGEKHLLGVMSDFFLAGPDTMSSTLAWGILYLSQYPEVQRKVQEELDHVVEKHRLPTLADRINLPYTCATIEEVYRLSSIIPLGLFHRAVADVKFHGYDIAKGTWICHNQYYLQMSEEIWENPEQFQPERHLSADGKTLKRRHEANSPFGVGKRACVGESLARDAVYLFFSCTFHKNRVQLSESSQGATFMAKPGIVVNPPDYTVVMTERV